MTRKRFLSILLTFVMVLSLIPGNSIAVAADGTTDTVIEQQDTASETALPENTDGAEESEEHMEATETPMPTETPVVPATPTDTSAVPTETPNDSGTNTEQSAENKETVFTVTFEVNGGSEVEAQQVKAGETAEEPEAPVKKGFTFGGWFEDGTYTVAFDFATPITGDVKIYAKWTDIEADQPAFSDTKTVNGVAVTVSAPEGVFPKESSLSVDSVPVFEQSMVDEAVENERDANANVAVSYTFDIKVLDAEGNEVQPADAQSVKVSFALAEAKDDNLEAQVYHISDDGTAEALDTSINGDAVEAVTDGFSFYTVEFTYGTMTYVLPGGSEVKLSDVLSYVGLSGEVTSASGSNDELFSVTKESGDWMILSHQPFDTEETLSVTINGIFYEIIVTDTNVSGTIYASNLADNDNLVLTGDTTLVMDVPRKLTSISGDYELNIEGNNALDVVNPNGDTINVKSLRSSVFLRLIAGKSGVDSDDLVVLNGGVFVISELYGIRSDYNAVSIGGGKPVSIYCNQIAIDAGRNVYIEVSNLTIESQYKGIMSNLLVQLVGGTINIKSVSCAIHCLGPILIEDNANITASSSNNDAIFAHMGGNIFIGAGCSITAEGAEYGIHASSNINIVDGVLNAKGSSGAVYSNVGTVKIQSPLAITTPDGGRVSGKTIVGTDGKTATEVVIQNRPLPGSVAIEDGDEAEVGDVLTLKFSDDFPLSGRSVQWQKEVGGTWEDIPGETNWSYIAKAADQGRAFRVRVSVAGYSGERFSNHCTILVKSTLGGTVTYNGSAYVGQEVISYRDAELNAIYYSVPTGAFHYQWEISNNGSTGWTEIVGATTDKYTPVASDDGKYIRVCVTVAGYTGSVYGSALKVSKAPKAENNGIPAAPTLTTASPYTTVTITNAKASQEYVFNYTGLPPSDWSGAQSPAADGTLTLNVESGKLVRVFTRYKETETTNAGTEVRHSAIPTYDYVEIQGVEFDKNELIVVQPGTYELNFVPIPDDFVWGARPVTWTFDNNYVQLFKDAYGLQPISSGDKVNGLTKVYVKGTGQTPETIIKADAQIGANFYTAYCSAEVSDNMAQFALRHLDFGGGMIQPPGTNSAASFKIIPARASVGTVTFEKTSGPASTLGLEVRSIGAATGTLDVHVPADAKEGTYVYSVKVDGAETPEPSTLTITVLSDKVTVTFDANGGFGNMAPETMWLGTWYILPECGFTAPDGMEFDGWDKGDPGDYITVGENTKITAQWKPHEHDLVFVPGFEPTCELDGQAAYFICDGCGKWFSDASGSAEITDASSVIIPATGHSLTLVPAKAATCTEDGNHAYYECSVCGDWFEDATGAVKITDYLSVIIDALGHDWSAWTQTIDPTTTTEGEETRTCSRCHETEKRSIPKLGVTSYEIIVNVGAHGSAHASAGASEEGKTITITATPDGGYEIDKITWTPDGGTATDITSTKSFEMPAKKVTVDVSFKASSVTPPGPATVTGISLVTPGKTAYTVGETLDVSGMEIKVDYSDGTSATIPVAAAMVSGFDSSAPATSQTLTITYEGKTTTYDVSISAAAPVTYDITVNAGAGGTANASASKATAGTTITITATPNGGYEIDKITLTPEGGTATDITSTKSFEMPAKKVTVSVSFKASSVTPPGPTTYTVTFKDGDSVLSTVTVNSGEKVAKPADPTKTDHTFNGWYADATFTAAFDFDQQITANATVYAKFTKNSVTPPVTITYTVTGGANSTWTKGSSATVTITVKRGEADDTCFSHFTGVEIDGVALAVGDYEAVSGSTVVTLKAAALQKLSVGSHTVTVKFDDGQASTGLTVKAGSGSTDKPTSPKTGDDSNLRLWVLLMLLSILGFITTVAIDRKKRQHSR